MSDAPSYIGVGLYTLADASRLIGVPQRRIRRWLEGYSFRSSGKQLHSGPIVASVLGRSAGALALTFADLLEVKFLDAFLQHGVTWAEIRRAVEGAREIVGSDHPFSTKRFKTDGRTILAEISRRGARTRYLDVGRSQYVFATIIKPFFIAQVEFNDLDRPGRWWPLTKRRRVLIDPERAFGAPIVADGSVRTRVLALSARAEGSARAAAAIYDVPLRAVNDAVEFESQLAA